MKTINGCLIGLILVVSVSAEPLLEGRVRLDSGEPVVDAQVHLYDLTDLRQGAIARAMTDRKGYFALPLAALSGQALPARFALGANLSQSVQSLDDHSLSTGGFVPSAAGGVQPIGTAYCDVGGWGAVGGLSHGDVARDGWGRPRRGGGSVYLPDDGGHGEPDGSDGAA